MEFTFILLTKGRFDIASNIDSFLNLNNKDILINLIIVDGNKDDQIQRLINKRFYNYQNIKVIKQKKGRFVRSCLEGLSHLKTDYFTFVYDDDYTSPHFSRLIEIAHKYNCSVIGNGVVVPKEDRRFIFSNLEKPIVNQDLKLFKNYFHSKKIDGKYLPASPACSVFKKKIADLWLLELKDIILDKYKFYYILKKNIGQDLLLYLIATFNEKNLLYFQDYSAQFTSHEKSMSVKYGSNNLGIGYWLTKKFYFTKIKDELSLIDNILIRINLFLRGLKLAINQIFNKNSFSLYSSKGLWKEIILTLVV